MSLVSTVYDNCKPIIQSALTTNYSELTHMFSPEKAQFSGAEKRWGLIPEGAPTVQGETKANTYDMSFRLMITDTYITQEESDSGIVSKVITLMGLFEEVFSELSTHKAGTSNVLLVHGFSIEKSVILEEEHIIAVDGTFIVRVRKTF